ncbi:hypothetical protein EDB85DRAFT_2275705 [Lactarius pseudohatsudake]|nr:hypothetical protein EDB85DRAFT_2275705 [Lactarius pseudohatsudake]
MGKLTYCTLDSVILSSTFSSDCPPHPLIRQPYAEQVFGLHKARTRFEPEVALAIAPGSEPPHHDDPPEGPDSYLADHGFEYIDGERTRHLKGDGDRQDTDTDTADGEGDGEPVPGLPCVIDALSTIMWPYMVRRGREAAPFGFDALLAATRAHGLLDAAPAPMLLLPSHTSDSYRSLRPGTSGFPSDVDDLAGYGALDDRGSFFSPEHGFEDADADPRTLVGLIGACAPFDLADFLPSLQTIREDIAGIENEAQLRAATARFAS